jgi:phage terminase large subunit
MIINLPYKFKPRDYQEAFCNATRVMLFIIVFWHRRAGKDLAFLSMLVPKMIERVGLYFYIFPTAKQGRKIIWKGIDKDGNKFIDRIPKELIAKDWRGKHKINNQEMTIEMVNGSIFSIVGSDNYDDTIIGTNPVGAVFSEISLQKPEVFDYIRPILKENGGFAWMNGTPRGKNFAYRQLRAAQANCKKWFTQVLSIKDTGVLTEQDVEDEIADGMPRARAEQEFYCSFNAEEAGLIYGREMNLADTEKRITKVAYDPTLPWYTFWDLGISDSMCIIPFQVVGNMIQMFDYHEDTGRGMEHYYTEVIKPLEAKLGSKCEEHFAPHDIKQREMMIQDESGDAMTRLAGAAKFGLHFTRIPRVASIWDRINTARGMLARCLFDSGRCARLVDAVSSYKKRKNESLSTPNNDVFDQKPLHDWASHGSDAFGGLCCAVKQGLVGNSSKNAQVFEKIIKKQIIQEVKHGYNPFA